MRTIARTSLLGSMALAMGAISASLSAQQADTMRAELGTLSHIEPAGAYQLVTTNIPGPTGEQVQRTYRADETTLVEGLGGIMSVEEITARSNGSIVVVTFSRDGQQAIAENIRFTGDDDILVTQGTVVEVDSGETLVLDAEGERQRMDLDFGRGATIDSDQGLLTSDDLSAGDEVTVYYSDRVDPSIVDSDLEGHARLIYRNDR